jgi:hypothetical protein
LDDFPVQTFDHVLRHCRSPSRDVASSPSGGRASRPGRLTRWYRQAHVIRRKYSRRAAERSHRRCWRSAGRRRLQRSFVRGCELVSGYDDHRAKPSRLFPPNHCRWRRCCRRRWRSL